MIVILATVVAFGACDPSPTDWVVTYSDGIVEHYSTTENRLDLEPRPGLSFSIVQCQNDVCSAPQEFVGEPMPGDSNFDGCVGLEDFLELSQRFGECIR